MGNVKRQFEIVLLEQRRGPNNEIIDKRDASFPGVFIRGTKKCGWCLNLIYMYIYIYLEGHANLEEH